MIQSSHLHVTIITKIVQASGTDEQSSCLKLPLLQRNLGVRYLPAIFGIWCVVFGILEKDIVLFVFYILHFADIVNEQYFPPTLHVFRYEFLFEPDEEGKEQKLTVSNILKAMAYLKKRGQ